MLYSSGKALDSEYMEIHAASMFSHINSLPPLHEIVAIALRSLEKVDLKRVSLTLKYD